MRQQRRRALCAGCGSPNVLVQTWTFWSVKDQEWVLEGMALSLPSARTANAPAATNAPPSSGGSRWTSRAEGGGAERRATDRGIGEEQGPEPVQRMPFPRVFLAKRVEHGKTLPDAPEEELARPEPGASV